MTVPFLIKSEERRDSWSRTEELHLVSRRWDGARHRVIARELNRTPRAVDQKVARLKAEGRL